MRMFMTVTLTSNVANQRVTDDSLVSKKDYDWEEKVRVLDITIKEPDEAVKTIKVKDISVYDHRLMVDDDSFCILKTFSK